MKDIKTLIIFVQVKDIDAKQQAICTLVHKHFRRSDSILITAPSKEAAIYIDQLLWRWPADSFIPHTITDTLTKERVVITTSKTNINQASILINLCPTIYEEIKNFHLAYELLDLTHPLKEQQSRKRHADYQAAGLHVKLQERIEP